MQLIVLGMHRSGTSGVTRILNMAGAWFGPEGIATDANEQNPKGFWERRDVRELCDDLLRGAGAEWWKISGFSVDEIPADVLDAHRARFSKILLHLDAHRPWVVKEPRLSLLLPVVRPLLEVPVCVHVVREPLEVAASVGAHHGFSRPGALALWEAYTRHAFAASAGLPRLVVDYDDLVRDPVATVHALVEHLEGLGVQGLHVPTDREITAFITPDLHRHRRRVEERAGNLNEEQLRLAAMLDDGSILDTVDLAELSDGAREALRTLEEDEERRTRLAELEAQVTELAARVERTIVDLDTSREQLGAVRGDLAAATEVRTELREKLGAMRAQLADEQRRGRELDRSVRAEARARRALASTSEQHLRTLERQLGSLARSRVLRATWRARSLRLPLSRRGQRERSPNPAQRAVKEVRRALREVERRAGDDPEGPPAPAERAASSASATATVRHRRSVPGRRKVAVIAWDVGHNPVGRAHVLAGILGRRF